MDVTAEDLLPLVAKLSPEERLRLSRMVLCLDPETGSPDARGYAANPVGDGEFSSGDDPLSWDADGWDDLS